MYSTCVGSAQLSVLYVIQTRILFSVRLVASLTQSNRSAQCLQAVTIQGVNNSQASCLQGFSFCDKQDSTLTSVITYSADPYTVDGTPTQVRGHHWGCLGAAFSPANQSNMCA